MPVPIVFRRGSDVGQPTYDWFDLSTGAGLKTFYCCSSDDNAGDKFFLTPIRIPSSQGLTSTASGAGTVERDFDLTFANPEYVKGDALLHFTLKVDANKTGYVTVTYYHVTSGGVETSLGTARIASLAPGASDGFYRSCLKVALTSKNFAVNEKLRVSVSVTADGANASMYHDPERRQTLTESGTGATIDTDMVVQVPFRIDL